MAYATQIKDYRKKVLGCWMGKNIGGTLGAPFEWRRQVNQVSFYTQELSGEPLPNDDLDIQLLWLVALEERGIDVDARTLAEYWVLYVTPHWSEYGTAKINLRSGLVPPLSGSLHNDYKDSCGAFIRSEIWACITPGCPDLAARYAYQDAIIDHGDGEGVYAEVFCAALESAAFVVDDIRSLVDIGLSYIPENCGVARAVCDAVASHRSGKTWLEARDSVLAGYRGSTFFNLPAHISDADRIKGFGEGKQGWDAPSNLGMLVIGLLYGEGDFGRSVCTAVNCGEDTDCTGATAGSIFGILHGIDGIPEQWTAPVGRKIKTACLNLGELGYFGSQLPADIDDMTSRTEQIARQVILRRRPGVVLESDQQTAGSAPTTASLMSGGEIFRLYRNLGGPLHHFDFFDIGVDYGEGPLLCDGAAKTIRLRIYNTYKVQASLDIRWYTPEGWKVFPSKEGSVFSFPASFGASLEVEYQVEVERFVGMTARAVIELTSQGRPTVMLVPVILQNGNYASRTQPAALVE